MVEVKDGSNDVGKCSYDGRNRRIIRLSYTAGVLSETRRVYFTDDWQDVEERLGTAATINKQYVWGIRYIDELVCRYDGTPPPIYAAQDADFNTTAIADNNGNVVQRFQYVPYGHAYVAATNWMGTTDAYEWYYRFMGYIFDSWTGLYHCRNRNYLTALSRWSQRDLIGYGDGAGLYEFLRSDPIQQLDPQGTLCATCLCRPGALVRPAQPCDQTTIIKYWITRTPGICVNPSGIDEACLGSCFTMALWHCVEEVVDFSLVPDPNPLGWRWKIVGTIETNTCFYPDVI